MVIIEIILQIYINYISVYRLLPMNDTRNSKIKW